MLLCWGDLILKLALFKYLSPFFIKGFAVNLFWLKASSVDFSQCFQ